MYFNVLFEILLLFINTLVTKIILWKKLLYITNFYYNETLTNL